MAALVASMGSTKLGSPLASRVALCQSSFKGEKLSSASSVVSSVNAASPRAPQRLQQVQAIRKIKGKVVCASNDKTVSVEVVRLYTHPKYKKRIKSSKKYHAHDEENRCQVGDTVTLLNCAPISKTKKFVVSEIIPKRNFSQEQDLPPLESAVSAP